MARYEITADRYVVMTSDSNIKNKITFVNGRARYQKWVEEDLVNTEDNIPSNPESTARVAGGFGGFKNIFGYMLDMKRGENYYQVGSTIIRFKTPIDFVKARAVVTHSGDYYEETAKTSYYKLNPLAEGISWSKVGSPNFGNVTGLIIEGKMTYAGANPPLQNRTPVMPIWDSSLAPQGPSTLSYDWSSVPSKNEVTEIPRADVGYFGGGGDPMWFWDGTRFINRLSGSFGKTSESDFGPSDEFFGYNKLNYNDQVVDWNNPGNNWNPNAIKVDYIIRVESRSYQTAGDLTHASKNSFARRWKSRVHTITLYADNLRYDEAPFSRGVDRNYSYEYQDSIFMDVNAYVGSNTQNKATDVNSQKILDAYSKGKQVVQFDFKVIDKFLEIGDLVTLKNKYGEDVAKGVTFQVVSARKVCKSTFSQEIIAISTA